MQSRGQQESRAKLACVWFVTSLCLACPWRDFCGVGGVVAGEGLSHGGTRFPGHRESCSGAAAPQGGARVGTVVGDCHPVSTSVSGEKVNKHLCILCLAVRRGLHDAGTVRGSDGKSRLPRTRGCERGTAKARVVRGGRLQIQG